MADGMGDVDEAMLLRRAAAHLDPQPQPWLGTESLQRVAVLEGLPIDAALIAFLDAAYRVLLRRPPEAPGAVEHYRALLAGRPRRDVALDLLSSDEAAVHHLIPLGPAGEAAREALLDSFPVLARLEELGERQRQQDDRLARLEELMTRQLEAGRRDTSGPRP